MSSDPETQDSPAGTLWDAPNQQVVRDDASPPWQEGTGGEGGGPVLEGLDAMTKDELLAHAIELGVVPANAGMTKDELRAGIEAKQAELVAGQEPV